jgi:serine/threonine protein kinase
LQALLGPMHDIVSREAERRQREVERASRPKIHKDDLTIHAILGVGTFGRVKLVLHTKDDDRPYALKCMRKGQVIALKQVEHVMNEKNLLDMCDHPFLLRLAATFQDEDEIYMLLELALGGELFSVLRERNRFDEPTSRFYASCVCSAFTYLHDRQIVYRDLKPENLLFDAEGYLKVVDFGFAKILQDRTWTLCGTPEYLAPEIITNKGHNLAVDWWAFGILCHEMLFGQPPFCADDPMEIYQKILRNKYSFPSVISKLARDLISKLLVTNPAQRLGSLKRGALDVSSAPFFKGLDFAALEKKTLKAPYVPVIKSPTDTSNFDEYEEDSPAEWAKFNDKRLNLFKGF